jgi:putative Mg2+ transporter-C (MgtC) family protein
MPELRVQLCGDVSGRLAGQGRRYRADLWPLPLHPVVLSVRLIPVTVIMELEPRLELALLLRLILAGLLSAVLGWEREAAHKPAGLRTHMLVGVASALFTVLGELAVREYPGEVGGLRADPIRVIQAVAIGVGFLGSGVIFVSKDQESVRGLTTAGSIWATAAIGLAAGLGYYILAVGATLLLLLVLRGMARFDRD